MSQTTRSDMDIGLAMAFGAVAIAGAAVMYLAVETQLLAATGFGVALIAGGLAVGALHVYGS